MEFDTARVQGSYAEYCAEQERLEAEKSEQQGPAEFTLEAPVIIALENVAATKPGEPREAKKRARDPKCLCPENECCFAPGQDVQVPSGYGDGSLRRG